MDIISTKAVIKLEQGQGSLGQDSLCFICLQSISPTTNEQNGLLNFLFNHLKISGIEGIIVCQKCGKTLAKLVKLFSYLEKVQLEIDYFLGLIKNLILNSSKDKGNAFGLQSVRESCAEKCGEKIKCPKPKVILEVVDVSKFTKGPVSDDLVGNLFPKVILQRLDVSNLIKRRSRTSISNCSEDLSPNLNDNNSNLSINSKSAGPVLNVEVAIIKQEVNCNRVPTPDGIPECNSSSPVLDEIQSIKIELENSVRNVNGNQKRFTSKAKIKCSGCFKTFHRTSLKTHFDAVHLRLKPWKCPKCLKSFTTKQTLHRHIDSRHLHLKPYKCDLCNKSYANSDSFRRHNKRGRHKLRKAQQRSKINKCDLCEKIFKDFPALKWHKRDVHPEELFPCGVCRKMFKRKTDMKYHVLSVHEKQREFHCQVKGCDSRYFKPGQLAQHYRLKHPGNPQIAKKELIQSSLKGNPDNLKVDEIFKEVRIINADDE